MDDWQYVKQATQMFDRERLNLRRLNDLEVRKQYQFEITDRFGASDNLCDGEEINTARRTLKFCRRNYFFNFSTLCI